MKFSFDFQSINDVRPKALYSLAEFAHSDRPSFHVAQKSRHPTAIYNLSLTQVSSRMLNVARLADELTFPGIYSQSEESKQYVRILDAVDTMLDSLAEHVEDCEKIIKCLHENPASSDCKRHLQDFRKEVSLQK